MTEEQVPTLYEWVGGAEALRRLIDAFYDRVERDEPIGPFFRRATRSFRAGFVGYGEWGTRLAMRNSQDGSEVVAQAPVPQWGWGVALPYQP